MGAETDAGRMSVVSTLGGSRRGPKRPFTPDPLPDPVPEPLDSMKLISSPPWINRSRSPMQDHPRQNNALDRQICPGNTNPYVGINRLRHSCRRDHSPLNRPQPALNPAAIGHKIGHPCHALVPCGLRDALSLSIQHRSCRTGHSESGMVCRSVRRPAKNTKLKGSKDTGQPGRKTRSCHATEDAGPEI